MRNKFNRNYRYIAKSLVKCKDIKTLRDFNIVSCMILIKNDLSGLVGSWSVSVHAVIARTDLEERERWDESRRRDKIRRALRKFERTIPEASGRNVQSRRVESRIWDSRSYRDDALRMHLIPDRVRKTTVREERELFISRFILEHTVRIVWDENWLDYFKILWSVWKRRR